MRTTLACIAFLSIAFALDADTPRHVDPVAFKALIESGEGILLDVRTPEEFAQERIDDPSTIDFYSEDFEKRLKLLPRDKPIYVYCRSGGRSGKTLAKLQELGFSNAIDLTGGIGAWKSAGYPVETGRILSGAPSEAIAESELNRILNSDTPALLVFQTIWCVPCRAMKPALDAFETQHQGKIAVVRIDADANEKLVARFKAEGVPVLIFLRAQQEIWRHSGTLSLEELNRKF